MASILNKEFHRIIETDAAGKGFQQHVSAAPRMNRKMRSLRPAIERQSADAFAAVIRENIDEVGFDLAFRGILDRALDDGVVTKMAHGMLNGVAVTSASELHAEAAGQIEFFSLFTIPMTGNPKALAEVFSNPAAFKEVAASLMHTGFVDGQARIEFVPNLYHPADMATIEPSMARWTAGTVGALLVADAGQEEYAQAGFEMEQRFAALYDEPEHRSIDGDDDVTRFIVGAYMQTAPSDEMKLDGMLLSLGKHSAPDYLLARQNAFLADLGEVFEYRFDVGVPNTFARACSSVAFAMVNKGLLEEASHLGLSQRDPHYAAHEEMRYWIDEDLVMFETLQDGQTVGPIAVPYAMIARDGEWAARNIQALARTAIEIDPDEIEADLPKIFAR